MPIERCVYSTDAWLRETDTAARSSCATRRAIRDSPPVATECAAGGERGEQAQWNAAYAESSSALSRTPEAYHLPLTAATSPFSRGHKAAHHRDSLHDPSIDQWLTRRVEEFRMLGHLAVRARDAIPRSHRVKTCCTASRGYGCVTAYVVRASDV
jgi:hypothetical protein